MQHYATASRVPGSQDVVQLLHKGHGPVGISRPVAVVCDVDLLGPQSLELYVALLHRLLMAVILHAAHQGLIHVGIEAPSLGKLVLFLSIATQDNQVGSLPLCPAGALGHCPWHQRGCHCVFFDGPWGLHQRLWVLLDLGMCPQKRGMVSRRQPGGGAWPRRQSRVFWAYCT